MPTLCVIISFLIAIPLIGTLEWCCMQAEQHNEEDQPEYASEFGKESTQHNHEFLNFKRAIQAHNKAK